MKNLKYYITFILLIHLSFTIDAQDNRPSLEKNLELIGMRFTLPEQYDTLTHHFAVYDCSDTSCILRKTLRMVEAVLRNHDGQCKILVFVGGSNSVRYGKIIDNNKKIFGEISSLAYNRIKDNFKYGRRHVSASKQEIEDLKMMLTYYPQDSAKAIFNADQMLIYPVNFEGETCEGIYNCGRCVVVEKNGLDVFFYFIMTEKSIRNFDQYLSDLRGVFWFDE